LEKHYQLFVNCLHLLLILDGRDILIDKYIWRSTYSSDSSLESTR